MSQISLFNPPGITLNNFAISSSPFKPLNAKENTCAQIRINIIKALILVVSIITALKRAQVKRPENMVTKIEPNEPIAAASVGAATPPTMDPKTATTNRIGGTTTFQKRIHSSLPDTLLRSSRGMGGIISGFNHPWISKYMM